MNDDRLQSSIKYNWPQSTVLVLVQNTLMYETEMSHRKGLRNTDSLLGTADDEYIYRMNEPNEGRAMIMLSNHDL